MGRRIAFWIVVGCCLLVSIPAQAAGREAEVYLVRFSGAEGDLRFRYQDLPAAARYLSPVAFSVRDGTLTMRADSVSGLLENARTLLTRRPVGDLERVSVLLPGSSEPTPRAAKVYTVVFTMDELLARGGAWSGVPAAWACRLAADKSGWASGRVWARSVAFDARKGRLTVKVCLAR